MQNTSRLFMQLRITRNKYGQIWQARFSVSRIMIVTLRSYLQSYEVCQTFKHENMRLRGLLGEVPLAKQVFETVYLDCIGPLQTINSKSNK